MDKLLVTGGSQLRGSIVSSGSKNSTLAIMAGALLGKGETVLRNVPYIGDVETMIAVIRALGVRCDREPGGIVRIDATEIGSTQAPYDLVRRMRASFCVLGPVLSRKGYAKVAMPGGCDIGARPIDFHVKGLQALGAHVNVSHGYVEAQADVLTGSQVYLNFPSAGATQHIMTIASLAEGVTTIHNAAAEPEVMELARFLEKMGAVVHGAGTTTVSIEGVDELRATDYEIPFDRMETGTFAVAAAITRGDVRIENVYEEHVEPFVMKLREVGAVVETHGRTMRVRCDARPMATDIMTMPHPGFPTDMQQPFAALLCIADGTSVVTENVYERRFRYVSELIRMGANIKQEGRTAVITGTPVLNAAPVTASDLRAGAALICAALVADGVSEISGMEHVARGYDQMVDKLKSLGADIRYSCEKAEREVICVESGA